MHTHKHKNHVCLRLFFCKRTTVSEMVGYTCNRPFQKQNVGLKKLFTQPRTVIKTIASSSQHFDFAQEPHLKTKKNNKTKQKMRKQSYIIQ